MSLSIDISVYWLLHSLLKEFADKQTLLPDYNTIVNSPIIYFDYCCVWRNAVAKTLKTTKQSYLDYYECVQ